MDEKSLKTARFPMSGTFELTARCNQRCGMCFIRVDEERIRELGKRELTTAEWIDLARQAADMGTVNLLLTGGEPMIRPDFPEIYEAIMGMGFYLTLYTNATALTPKTRELLTRLPPHKVGITLYGASPETYEATCGVASGYEKTLEGIHFFRTLPSILEIRTTIVKSNLKDLDAIRSFAESLGEEVSFTISNIVSKQIRGGVADVASFRLSPEEQLRLYFDVTLREALKAAGPQGNARAKRRMHTTFEDMESAGKRREYEDDIRRNPQRRASLLGCGAGMDQYTITWDGRLIGCQMLDSRGTDALELGIRQAWEDYPLTVPPLLGNPVCGSCAHAQNCMACPATRLAESGDLSGVPEYSCQMARLTDTTDFTSEIQKNMIERISR